MEQRTNKSISAFLELLNYHIDEWIHCVGNIKKAVQKEIGALYGADFVNGVYVSVGWETDCISREGQLLHIVFPQTKPLCHDDLNQMFANLGIRKWYVSGEKSGGLELKAYILENIPGTEGISESEV